MQPFDLREMRAMISLGPLNKEQFCPFRCPFCYVNGQFPSYASLEIPEILAWLRQNQGAFDIIYLSGDTDSLAPPRTEKAIDLIEQLAEFEVDLMFTTRAILPPWACVRLADVAAALKRRDALLFGCTSISQCSLPHLEPRPIPPVNERIRQMHRFRDGGLVSVLAMRPFLPVVPTDDYRRIVTSCAAAAHMVFGKEWYADGQGRMDAAIYGGAQPLKYDCTLQRMHWDDNNIVWKVYAPKDVETSVAKHCETLGLPFFMRSRLGVEWARQNRDQIRTPHRGPSKPAIPQSPQVVGVGALNVNYVVPFSRAQARLKQITRGRIEAGQESWATEDEIEGLLAEIGYQNFDYCGLGGAAYHTVDCLAQIGLGLSLGYVGVAGAAVRGTGAEQLDILDRLDEKHIDRRYVFSSPNTPGRTVSIRNIKDRMRSNNTAPGANDELLSFLQKRRNDIITYLAGARWIHLSSLVDRLCMVAVADCVEEAKRINGRLIVSFDPGSEYCRKPEMDGTNIVKRVLACTDYLFVNSVEFDQLAKRDRSTRGDRESTETAAAVFHAYDCAHVCMVVQDTNYYRVQSFWMFQGDVLTRRDFQRPFWHSTVKEVTGASGILAAGYIAARMLPDVGYDSHLATRFAMALVREKLGRTGFEANGDYQRMLKRARARLRHKDNTKPFFEGLQPLNEDFIKGVLASIVAAAIVGGIVWTANRFWHKEPQPSASAGPVGNHAIGHEQTVQSNETKQTSGKNGDTSK